MNEEELQGCSAEGENHHVKPTNSNAAIDELFASTKIGDVLRQAKVPVPPAPKPDIAAIQKHRADQKRIPKVPGSKKPKKVHVQTRRSKPKGRQ